MNKYLIFLSAACLASVSYAKDGGILIQNTLDRDGISLNGQWSIIIDPYENGYYNHRYEPHEAGYFVNAESQSPSDLVEYNFTQSQKVQVPGDWNTQDEKLFFYEGTVWYHKNFNLSKHKQKRYVLHFGAVNYEAIVYVNGTRIGSHEGGFTPFQFDVTDHVNDGDNFVVVKVDNRRERDQIPTVNTDWWNYGGITRPVKLLELDENYLADYFVQLKPGSPNTIAGWVQVSGNKTRGQVTLRIPELSINESLKLNRDGFAEFEIKSEPALWSPDNPKLYAVELNYQDGKVADKIGFRTIAAKDHDILLNGESVYLRGISIHEESPSGNGRAWSEEEARILLGWAKELGCNFVRLAHYPHNEAMVRVADEIGLLVWSEIPVYWTVLFEDKTVYRKAEKQLSEMISRDKNRAAVILWSMANETPGSDARLEFIGDLATTARKMDNTRLITAALDTQTTTEHGKAIDDPLASIVDVIGINSYCGWYGGTPESCASIKWTTKYDKPVIMSEFGGGALQGKRGDKNERWTEEYLAEVYRHNLTMVDNIPFLRGLTPWILKDFRSPRRPLPDIQDFWNRKGLISNNGQRKDAWYILQDFYKKKEAQYSK